MFCSIKAPDKVKHKVFYSWFLEEYCSLLHLFIVNDVALILLPILIKIHDVLLAFCVQIVLDANNLYNYWDHCTFVNVNAYTYLPFWNLTHSLLKFIAYLSLFLQILSASGALLMIFTALLLLLTTMSPRYWCIFVHFFAFER